MITWKSQWANSEVAPITSGAVVHEEMQRAADAEEGWLEGWSAEQNRMQQIVAIIVDALPEDTQRAIVRALKTYIEQ